ncbi:hypothetical protein EMEDMD4_570032 [Sinorhizobium medicae]|uniref:Uncharacterized protein n=1 Tax=Sinorhizobium medicae TaxID=110321 RepID=A0A508X2T1_9HYPH|nr:hypothetical protein EMEDMD4_570032 [Sinorhizobium medicae]
MHGSKRKLFFVTKVLYPSDGVNYLVNFEP